MLRSTDSRKQDASECIVKFQARMNGMAILLRVLEELGHVVLGCQACVACVLHLWAWWSNIILRPPPADRPVVGSSAARATFAGRCPARAGRGVAIWHCGCMWRCPGIPAHPGAPAAVRPWALHHPSPLDTVEILLCRVYRATVQPGNKGLKTVCTQRYTP